VCTSHINETRAPSHPSFVRSISHSAAANRIKRWRQTHSEGCTFLSRTEDDYRHEKCCREDTCIYVFDSSFDCALLRGLWASLCVLKHTTRFLLLWVHSVHSTLSSEYNETAPTPSFFSLKAMSLKRLSQDKVNRLYKKRFCFNFCFSKIELHRWYVYSRGQSWII
jgi:hypothetical protein